jgi:hypothetical protein
MVNHGDFSVENPQIAIFFFFLFFSRRFGEKVLGPLRRFWNPFEGSRSIWKV